MNPVASKNGENFDVLLRTRVEHSTFNYLFEEPILHGDNLGSAVEIQVGAVNLATAGKEIVHS